MSLRARDCAIAATALLLAGCSYADDMFGTNWSGERQNADAASAATAAPAPAVSYQIPPGPAERAAQPMPGFANAASAAPTNTVVGQKVASLRTDLQRLKGSLAQHQQETAAGHQALERDSAAYFGAVGQINAKLQVGTTAGNPQLVAQWNQAQGMLDRMSADVGHLSNVSTGAAADSSLAAYLMNATRAAFSLQGAVDEDHRQLTQIQAEIDGTTVQIDALLTVLSDEIGRQSNNVANERENLITLSQAIKNGQLYGPSLANRAFGGGPVASAPLPAPRQARAPAAYTGGAGRPLVVIRFDRPDVAYEQALYTAVSRALERKPSANFELVAVAPNSGTSAQAAVNANASKRNAENVMRSLTSMGLPADRVSLSATTSTDVQNNEVRIFVR